MIELILLNLLMNQAVPNDPQTAVKIRIKTYQEDTYYLLTDAQPLDVTVEGPTWIRVYTRLPWHPDWTGTKSYKLIRQENGQQEKFVSMETEYSKVARLGSVRLSKWRSFFINVPKGRNTYRFIHWQSPSDSIFVKIAYESPGQWQELIPQSYAAKLELVEDERVIDYYEVGSEQPVIVDVSGPARIKFIVRFHCDPLQTQDRLFALTVKERNKTLKTASFRVHRSETTSYRNRPETSPSNPRTLYLNVRKGNHRLELHLSGVNDRAGIRAFTEQKR